MLMTQETFFLFAEIRVLIILLNVSEKGSKMLFNKVNSRQKKTLLEYKNKQCMTVYNLYASCTVHAILRIHTYLHNLAYVVRKYKNKAGIQIDE